MKPPRSILRHSLTVMILGTLILSSATEVLAGWAGASAGFSPPILLGKTWAVTYMLVFLAVALGMLVVCRPASRQKLLKKRKKAERDD